MPLSSLIINEAKEAHQGKRGKEGGAEENAKWMDAAAAAAVGQATHT